MKTYKIEAIKAASLRKQLLWSNIISFLSIIVAVALAFNDQAILTGMVVGVGLIAGIWSVVAYWRAVWSLWEWPGVGLALGVALAVAVFNTFAPLLGIIANLAFFVYIYMQLGNQTGNVEQSKREVFSE